MPSRSIRIALGLSDFSSLWLLFSLLLFFSLLFPPTFLPALCSPVPVIVFVLITLLPIAIVFAVITFIALFITRVGLVIPLTLIVLAFVFAAGLFFIILIAQIGHRNKGIREIGAQGNQIGTHSPRE